MENTIGQQVVETFGEIGKVFEMSKSTMELLDSLAAGIPLNPPLKAGGEAMTICEMYPDLTKTELDYVVAQYQGSMKRG
jgi:hypothetical protein